MIFAMRKIRMKKSCTISCFIVLSLALVMMTCSSEDPVEPEITFNSFSEEVQYLIESNFTFGGVAVGVIKGDTTFTLFNGTRSENSDLPPDENTVYEMGSVTKIYHAVIRHAVFKNAMCYGYPGAVTYPEPLAIFKTAVPEHCTIRILYPHLFPASIGIVLI